MNFGCKGWGQFACTVLQLKTPQRRPKDLSTSMSTTITTKSFSERKGVKTTGGRCDRKPSFNPAYRWLSSPPLHPVERGQRASSQAAEQKQNQINKSSGRKQRKSLPKDFKGLKVACWNIRTMFDLADSSRPERRSALVAHELCRHRSSQ